MAPDREEHVVERIANASSGSVDLYWSPLGVGAHIVRMSGKLFEFLVDLVQHRKSCNLYHSVLIVRVSNDRYIIEQAPAPDLNPERRGVLAGGPVGMRWLGKCRVFRYELRCWKDGVIPDIDEAVASPVRVTEVLTIAELILEVLPSIPTPVWGRDDARIGEMWNSNSVISWALTKSGVDATMVQSPAAGRAPGWNAGVTIAKRESQVEIGG